MHEKGEHMKLIYATMNLHEVYRKHVYECVQGIRWMISLNDYNEISSTQC